MVYGLIVAGGYSRRMGQDKSSMRLHAHDTCTLFERTAGVLESLGLPLLVSCRPDQQFTGYACVYDHFHDVGPIAGISAALEHSRSAVLAVSCDMPFLRASTLKVLMQTRAQRSSSVLMTTFRQVGTSHMQALVAIYEYGALPYLETFLRSGRCKVNEAIPACYRQDIVWSGSVGDEFMNINSPEDLLVARSHALAQKMCTQAGNCTS